MVLRGGRVGMGERMTLLFKTVDVLIGGVVHVHFSTFIHLYLNQIKAFVINKY